MAVLAARLDPKLELWSYAAAMPTNYESYRELRMGIDAFVVEEFEEATKHFENAAALDTTSATPLVWAAWALAYHRFWPQVEVLVSRIKSSGRNFGPWDRAVLDVVDAWVAGDLAASHAAGHRLAAAVPNSEWSFPLAWSAAHLGRANETIRVLRSIDPERGWMRGFPWYWASLARAYHTIGDHQSGLRLAREGMRREPSNRTFMYIETMALAALGRSDEIMNRCASARPIRTNSMFSGAECSNAIEELRAHGYQPAAHAIANAVVADDARLPKSEQSDWTYLKYLYDEAGAIAERDSILRLQPAMAISAVQRALLAAEHGDRASVQAALRDMSAAPPPLRWPRDSRLDQPVASDGSSMTYLRAQLAAMLGDKAEAVSWLNASFREGNWERPLLHLDRTLDRLRGYPPYEALLRPREEPEVVTRKPG
jgi:tetratricopeptide (TPR) repeat protein